MTNIEEDAKILRKFHNDVKFELYQKYCKNETSLLDIGCGRGGDMFKWKKVGINKVIGIDINKSYIIEAIKRYKYNSLQLSNSDYQFFFTKEKFIFLEFLNYRNLQKTFDNVCCMFALHYFFNNKENAINIFEQVSQVLKHEGYFFGTIMNGTKVNNYVKSKEIYNTNAMFIKREYNQILNYGSKIQFMLSGTLYFGEKTLSSEYLIFEATLKSLGEMFNMTLVEFNCFDTFYNENYKMSKEFQDASFLNYTFSFKKN